MKRYTSADLTEAPPGWYWARRYRGAPAVAVPVTASMRTPYWAKDSAPTRCIVIDFGYCEETMIYPAYPEQSDQPDPSMVLIGPLLVPDELLS